MTKALVRFLLVCSALLSVSSNIFGQTSNSTTDTTLPVRIAILAPIYIDSVFTGDEYAAGNTLPNYMLPGLDFYNGAMMAVDSLQKENIPAEVWVYDTKKSYQTTAALEAEMLDKDFSLIIAFISNAAEQQELSTFSFNHNIPFISGTYPNDAGIAGNPYYAIINSTLKTHVQGMYNYISRYYTGGNVYYITRTGAMEQKIKGWFDAMKSSGYPLKYSVIELQDNFAPGDILSQIDTTEEGAIVCGSLNVDFGSRLLKAMNNSPATKHLVVAGMPTWDDMDALYNEDCKNVNIVYSTPYNYSRADKLVATLANEYRAKFKGRPSDMVFKGFDQVYHFTHLLLKYQDSLFAHLSDNSYKISNDYNFQPVRLSKTSYAPDYLENKKLYYIKIAGGSIKSVN